MKNREVVKMTIALVCMIVIVLSIYKYTKAVFISRETFADGQSVPVALPVALPGALPQSTIILNNLNSIKFFSEQNFEGSLLKAMQVGENSDKDSVDALKTAQSIRVPENILLQIFGKGGQQISLPGLAEISIWQPPDWEITRCVVYFSPMTGSSTGELNVPEPARDDWRDTDKYVIGSIESDIDFSNVPRFDIMSIFQPK